MEITLHPGLFTQGAYGLVYWGQEKNFAIKIFRKTFDHPEDHVSEVWRAEDEAYKIASSDPLLSEYIAPYFGQQKILNVYDRAGTITNEKYFLEFNIKLGYLNGAVIKCGNLNSKSRASFEVVREEFANRGIHYLNDCSVVLNADGSIGKILDFAVKEIPLAWED